MCVERRATTKITQPPLPAIFDWFNIPFAVVEDETRGNKTIQTSPPRSLPSTRTTYTHTHIFSVATINEKWMYRLHSNCQSFITNAADWKNSFRFRASLFGSVCVCAMYKSHTICTTYIVYIWAFKLKSIHKLSENGTGRSSTATQKTTVTFHKKCALLQSHFKYWPLIRDYDYVGRCCCCSHSSILTGPEQSTYQSSADNIRFTSFI